jgi:hypothetical protein
MALHHALIRGLIDRGRVPGNAQLGRELGLGPGDLELALQRLAASHSLVLHPHRCEPWIVHPFSTSPTHTWVARGERGWWAPCLWCALGITALASGEVVIHTRIGGEHEPLRIPVRDGVPAADGLWAHFPEPPRLAWANVHHFCARLLPFRSPAEITAWGERHGLPVGEAVPLAQLADLARRWYGRHADPEWRKATVAEAAAVFRAAGLTGGFWQLEPRAGTF